MKVKMPWNRHSTHRPDSPGHTDAPRVAAPAPHHGLRVLGTSPEPSSLPDHSGWYRREPGEGFRILPGPPQAGYRWGATTACDYDDPPEPSVDTAWSHPGALERRDDLAPATTGERLPALRAEYAVTTLVARTDGLTTALERLEHRVEDLADRLIDVVTHEDLVEIESRRARLAAEVSRLAVELRAEVDHRLSEMGRVIAAANHRAATVDHRGPLDLADERRLEIHVNHLEASTKVAELAALPTRRTA